MNGQSYRSNRSIPATARSVPLEFYGRGPCVLEGGTDAEDEMSGGSRARASDTSSRRDKLCSGRGARRTTEQSTTQS